MAPTGVSGTWDLDGKVEVVEPYSNIEYGLPSSTGGRDTSRQSFNVFDQYHVKEESDRAVTS